ncbi:unnamed protein product [Gadus morhua 'NCC']
MNLEKSKIEANVNIVQLNPFYPIKDFTDDDDDESEQEQTTDNKAVEDCPRELNDMYTPEGDRLLPVLKVPKANTRRQWTKAEENAVMRHFKSHVIKGNLASKQECSLCKECEPALKKRTIQNIRRGYQDYPAAARQDVALHAFLRGLKPERLGQHVRLARPQTLAVVLDEAHLWRWFCQPDPVSSCLLPLGHMSGVQTPGDLHTATSSPGVLHIATSSLGSSTSPPAARGSSKQPPIALGSSKLPPSVETLQSVDDLMERSCEGLEADQGGQLQELMESVGGCISAALGGCVSQRSQEPR